MATAEERIEDRVAPIDVAVVCALSCEADPVISMFDLVRQSASPTWRSDRIALAVAGVGTERAAAAVERLSAFGDASTCWLNLGCAGGRGVIGELIVAHRVVGPSGDDWYPQFPFPVAEPTCNVYTVREPETRYRQQGLYEMEAAGFYPAALGRSSLERVQVMKVRVDGPHDSIERLDADGISDHIRRHAAVIREWVERLGEVAYSVRRRRPPRRVVDAYLDCWHFTVSQEVQLCHALERLHAVSVDVPAPRTLSVRQAGEAIAVLNRMAAGTGHFWWTRDRGAAEA